MGKSRKVSSISKEFDGKEVQGKRIERSGLFGSKVTKEVFNFPKGGKHIEKTRTNKKGDVVSRMSKDTKVNPLAFFNKNKEQAYKKAGGAMTAFKKSLKKAQDGIQMGPYVAPKEYWFDDPNKRAAYDAKTRESAARVRDNNNDPDAEREYGRLANSYSPNGPNLDLPNEINALNKKYPFAEGFSEVEFKGGNKNKGWDKVRAEKPAKDKSYKQMDPNSEYMGEPEWKKKGGSVKRKK
jgi:hypothetical protein